MAHDREDTDKEIESIRAILASDVWKDLADATTLNAGEKQSFYLENRLRKVLNQGISLGRQLEKERIGKAITKFIS